MENFFSFYNLGLYLFILLIPTYVLLITTSIAIEKEPEVIDIKVLFKEKIEYLIKSYHRIGQTDKCKDLNVLIKNYQNLDFEEIAIVNTIEEVANRYEELEQFISSLELYYEIIKIKKKIEPENTGSIINTWEKLMTLNSYIGNKDEARKILLYMMSLRSYKTPNR
tara:strand:+ start:46 stop:543 length:498 start_codon:yes stop_codon:yes gene_type:complete